MSFQDLNKRSIDIFRNLVDAYLETGEPVGSRTLSKRLENNLSPATIRNIMSDLEEAGLLYAPHTSAGRLPTEDGLHYFVNGLLELNDIIPEERKRIEDDCSVHGKDIKQVLESATQALSGLSQCAGIVFAPKTDAKLRQVEFVPISAGKVLVILIGEDGHVENRLLEVSPKISPSVFEQASNYINHHIKGRTLNQALSFISSDLKQMHQQLDNLAAGLIADGLAVWGGGDKSSLIVKGQSHLFDHANDIEHIRTLFNMLEAKEVLCNLLESSVKAQGVQIFIGAENKLFNLAGCSMIVAPYQNNHVVGAIGVIGPMHMNYGRIIPMVDFTSKVVARILGQKDE